MKHTRTFDSFLNESAKADKLVPLMVKAIEKVDDSLSYTDLAIAVAEIIKEQYGDHNIVPFMKELHKQLSIKESKDSDTFVGNPGEDERMVDIRAFRGSVKDLTDFIEDKIKENQVAEGVEIKSAKNKHGEEFKIGDQIVAPDKKSVKITGFMKGKDGHMKAMYNAGMFADVYNLDDVEKI